jgi:hypothetical protein
MPYAIAIIIAAAWMYRECHWSRAQCRERRQAMAAANTAYLNGFRDGRRDRHTGLRADIVAERRHRMGLA